LKKKKKNEYKKEELGLYFLFKKIPFSQYLIGNMLSLEVSYLFENKKMNEINYEMKIIEK
jgi:hypothetical protein